MLRGFMSLKVAVLGYKKKMSLFHSFKFMTSTTEDAKCHELRRDSWYLSCTPVRQINCRTSTALFFSSFYYFPIEEVDFPMATDPPGHVSIRLNTFSHSYTDTHSFTGAHISPDLVSFHSTPSLPNDSRHEHEQ